MSDVPIVRLPPAAVEIRTTRASDFDRIYPLLTEFDSPFSREDWQRLFTYQWEGARDFVGFHLEHDGEVVGFMGLVFSRRRRAESTQDFCNITSLIVKEPYRPSTTLLVRKLRSVEGVIFTGLRPIEASFRLLSIVGFVPYEHRFLILPAARGWFSGFRTAGLLDSPDGVDGIDAECRRVAADHVGSRARSLVCTIGEGRCMLMYTVMHQTYGVVPVTKVQVLYISDIPFFNRHLGPILRACARRWGPLSALYVDARFVDADHARLSIARPISPPRICSSRSANPLDIDEAYTETVLL